MKIVTELEKTLQYLHEENTSGTAGTSSGTASKIDIEDALVEALAEQGVIDAIVNIQDDLVGIELETDDGVRVNATITEDEDGVVFANALINEEEFETSFPATTVDGAISVDEVPYEWFGKILSRALGEGDAFEESYRPALLEKMKVKNGKLIRIKKKRRLTPAQRRALVKNLKLARKAQKSGSGKRKAALSRKKSMKLRKQRGLK